MYITIYKLASGNWPYDAGNPRLVLYDNLERWDAEGGGREAYEGGNICILWLIHVEVWQTPSQYCKLPVLKLKIKFKKRIN